MQKILPLLALLTVFMFTASPEAALYDRSGGMIYDDVLGITWIQDANYAMTSSYDTDGKMTWNEATAWADQLSFGGFDDWRLPASEDVIYSYGYDGTTSARFNITSSEMGYMYYENLNGVPLITVNGDTNGQPGITTTSFFNNIKPRFYWSATQYDNNHAWGFNFQNGAQGLEDFSSTNSNGVTVYTIAYAWAVRDGDVLSAPIPSAAWLLCSGFLGLIALQRKLRN